jgi:hypothetical protein
VLVLSPPLETKCNQAGTAESSCSMSDRSSGMAYAPAMPVSGGRALRRPVMGLVATDPGVTGSTGSSSITQGPVRLARAAIFGGMSLLLATAGHLAGGGALPDAALLTLTGVGLALVAASLTARRVRFATVVSVLAVEQLLVHLLFHAASVGNGCADVVMPGHAMTATTVCGGAVSSGAADGWSMLLGHSVAVLVIAWLLARGERWLWRAVDRIHGYASVRPTRLRRARTGAILVRTAGPVRIASLSVGSRAPPLV